MLKFNDIKITDKNDIENYLKKYNLGICEHCFTDIFMWQNYYKTKFVIFEDVLYIRSKSIQDDEDYFMFPLGHGDMKKAIRNIINTAKEEGIEPIFVSITEELKVKICEQAPEYFEFFESPESADYIYTSEKLRMLSGKKMHAKRNFVNRFMSENEGKWSFEELNDTNKEDIWEFHKKWHKESSGITEEKSLEAETKAIKNVLENYKELDVKGGILKISDEIVAFSLGSKSSNDMFVVQIEKANTEFAGAYPTINKLFAEKFCNDVEFINREEDLGIEGLKKAKLSYKPDILRMKYNAKIRGNV